MGKLGERLARGRATGGRLPLDWGGDGLQRTLAREARLIFSSRRYLRSVLFAAAVVIPCAPLAGQESPGAAGRDGSQEEAPPSAADRFFSSAYLPLGHWAYPLLDNWVASGRITELDPLIQPYRRIEVARAILHVQEDSPTGTEGAWMPALEKEFALELRALRGERKNNNSGFLYIDGGLGVYSQTHRDLMRAELSGPTSKTRALGQAFVNMSGQAGAVAGAFRGGADWFYKYDAQFFPRGVAPAKEGLLFGDVYFRVPEGYAELQTKYARVFFGRMYRNWGLPGLDGFMRSDYAYSEEELSYRFGPKWVFLVGSIASYSDFRRDTTHYVSMHRLEIRPVDNFIITFGEAVVHGGPSQALVWKFINPISVWHVAADDNDPPHNKIGELSAWWRPTNGVALYGSYLADATNLEGSCCQAGGSFAVDLPSIAPGLGLGARFTALQSLVYRTGLPWEGYLVEGIGLGWDKIDLYMLTIEADWLGATRYLRSGGTLTLQPRLDLQWMGEQVITELRPPPDQLPDFPRILSGVTETTVRPAIAGRWRQPIRPFFVDVQFDLGVNFVSNFQHQTGDNRSTFVGNLKVLIETPHWSFGLD